jgi:hypothetical protein
MQMRRHRISIGSIQRCCSNRRADSDSASFRCSNGWPGNAFRESLAMLIEVGEMLQVRGLKVGTGTIYDATSLSNLSPLSGRL